MKLYNLLTMMAGGMGSGCNPSAGKCGRHPGGGSQALTVIPKGAKFLYHGTTDKFIDSIKKQGLTGKKNYVTTNYVIANGEAAATVHGDPFSKEDSEAFGHGMNWKPPKGGSAVVVVLDASHPSIVNLIADEEMDDAYSYHTTDKISPKAILGVFKVPKASSYDVTAKDLVKMLKRKRFLNPEGTMWR